MSTEGGCMSSSGLTHPNTRLSTNEEKQVRIVEMRGKRFVAGTSFFFVVLSRKFDYKKASRARRCGDLIDRLDSLSQK